MNNNTTNILEQFEKINTLIFDIDGVLTTDDSHLTADGELVRTMNIKDGYALQLAIKEGFNVWIISAGKSVPAQNRLLKLGLKEVHIAVGDKGKLMETLMEKYQVGFDTVLYMGDDMPDIKPIELALIGACPQDACSDVKNISNYISPIGGGRGCVRDVIEKVMKSQAKWK